jgi:hypothetical protein
LQLGKYSFEGLDARAQRTPIVPGDVGQLAGERGGFFVRQVNPHPSLYGTNGVRGLSSPAAPLKLMPWSGISQAHLRASAAGWLLRIVWCKGCQHQVEPSREVDFVLTGASR